MIKIKKDGFTLSEVLITLAIVGVLAVLVIPGLVKDTNNKAMMSLLQGTVSIFNNAVQNELTSVGTSDIKNTDAYNDPVKFLKTRLEVRKECTGGTPNACYGKASEYRNLNGGNVGIWTNSGVLLANGVAIDILKNNINNFADQKYLPVGIDLNGSKEPNIAGVDRWIICIALKTDDNDGIHSGDVGSCLRTGYTTSSPKATLKNACKNGSTEVCYYLAEISGFDAKYLDN